MTELIDAQHLTKRYRENLAVDDVFFTVSPGEILCLLGPNGAGKSTTIRMLTGTLRPDSGEIRSGLCGGLAAGRALRAYQQRLGTVPQELALYEDLTAAQNVRFFASLYGLKGARLKEQTEEALVLAGLSERANDKVNTFSGGMKRRLNIACALAHRPALLILDEPTVGIDPQSRSHILEAVKRLAEEGTGVVYTTHYMEEVDQLRGRIIIMDGGKIIASGTADTLAQGLNTEKHIIIEAEGLETLDESALYLIEGVRHVRKGENTLDIAAIRSIENLDRIITCLTAQNRKISRIETRQASLETVFLELTGRSLRDGEGA